MEVCKGMRQLSILEIMKYKFHQQVFKCKILGSFCVLLELIFAAAAASAASTIVVLSLSLQCTSHPSLSADDN